MSGDLDLEIENVLVEMKELSMEWRFMLEERDEEKRSLSNLKTKHSLLEDKLYKTEGELKDSLELVKELSSQLTGLPDARLNISELKREELRLKSELEKREVELLELRSGTEGKHKEMRNMLNLEKSVQEKKNAECIAQVQRQFQQKIENMENAWKSEKSLLISRLTEQEEKNKKMKKEHLDELNLIRKKNMEDNFRLREAFDKQNRCTMEESSRKTDYSAEYKSIVRQDEFSYGNYGNRGDQTPGLFKVPQAPGSSYSWGTSTGRGHMQVQSREQELISGHAGFRGHREGTDQPLLNETPDKSNNDLHGLERYWKDLDHKELQAQDWRKTKESPSKSLISKQDNISGEPENSPGGRMMKDQLNRSRYDLSGMRVIRTSDRREDRSIEQPGREEDTPYYGMRKGMISGIMGSMTSREEQTPARTDKFTTSREENSLIKNSEESEAENMLKLERAFSNYAENNHNERKSENIYKSEKSVLSSVDGNAHSTHNSGIFRPSSAKKKVTFNVPEESELPSRKKLRREDTPMKVPGPMAKGLIPGFFNSFVDNSLGDPGSKFSREHPSTSSLRSEVNRAEMNRKSGNGNKGQSSKPRYSGGGMFAAAAQLFGDACPDLTLPKVEKMNISQGELKGQTSDSQLNSGDSQTISGPDTKTDRNPELQRKKRKLYSEPNDPKILEF